MSANYKYIDPDYVYNDSQSGLLKNKENITDKKLLAAFESLKVSRRLEELHRKPVVIKSAITLLDLHKHLFQDVYNWAGKTRTVEISKDGKQFFPVSRFHTAFSYIDSLITEYRSIAQKDKQKISLALAKILDAVNYLHPFREGNGRTQREFLRTLALEKGLDLDLNPPDNADVYEKYMSGTVNSDIEKLTALIFELISQR